ncbi:unnamed protein product (macronuclear) [Paramecium tetraurelia]|uniref:Uncharacterized protein n=1 Tax=Paramecium tetraurelia TaxID=5888 RepID=A0EEH4_PARTE|nr:uncharacterized protein GSPATT00026037001 [Paramecium tetraurelia]CAK93702.1 unnamed protein product [Paramecium tetraurelia]|eukprot:XP_001461088.1 hypothetical protein (macronuclear) [Paramecium tetraurelia strain d4-2]
MTKQECISILLSMFNDFQETRCNNLSLFVVQRCQKDSINELLGELIVILSYTFLIQQYNTQSTKKQSVVAITKNEIQLLLAELKTKNNFQMIKKKQQINFLVSFDVSRIDMKHNRREFLDNELSFICNFEQQE